MTIVRIVALLLIASSCVVLASGSAPAGCMDNTVPSIQVGQIHMRGTANEFWEETNDLPGLQRQNVICLGHPSIPADTCITHSENNALLACLTTYSTGSLA